VQVGPQVPFDPHTPDAHSDAFVHGSPGGHEEVQAPAVQMPFTHWPDAQSEFARQVPPEQKSLPEQSWTCGETQVSVVQVAGEVHGLFELQSCAPVLLAPLPDPLPPEPEPVPPCPEPRLSAPLGPHSTRSSQTPLVLPPEG
jgi:hypothetical protein